MVSVQLPILLQNRNGPCALLAIANGLLLLSRVCFPVHRDGVDDVDGGAVGRVEVVP